MENEFDSDASNQAQKIIFTRKKLCHPSVYLNNIPAVSTTVQKHLGMSLNDKLRMSSQIDIK